MVPRICSVAAGKLFLYHSRSFSANTSSSSITQLYHNCLVVLTMNDHLNQGLSRRSNKLRRYPFCVLQGKETVRLKHGFLFACTTVLETFCDC